MRDRPATNIGRRFPTTSWTIVSAASRQPDALANLCSAYWYPVYGYIRRRGHTREEAEDLTQQFFAQLLEHRALAAARRERGKFRSFLLASVANFLANEWDRSQAQKRGAGAPSLSLDFDAGEARYIREPADNLTPEALFERQWALALLDRAMDRLRVELHGSARGQPMLEMIAGNRERGAYEHLAAELKLSLGATKVAVHRLRRRYSELVREEIAAIVEDPADREGEIRFLLAALGRV